MNYWFGCRVSESGTGSKPHNWLPQGPYTSRDVAEGKQRDAREPDIQISEVFSAQSEKHAMEHLERESE